MDFSHLDELINSFIKQIKPDSVFPTKTEPKSVNTKDIPSGAYRSPIHDTWYSSGGFTYRTDPTHPKGHMGVDMRAPGGTAIYPLAAGVVTNVGTDPYGGNVVNVQHANNVRTYYAHLAAAKVHKGDHLTTDTVIGTVGMSGNAKSTVPHCHFQVWQNNQIQDPAKYFTVPPYTNLNAQEKRQGQWLSEEAKQEAAQFNMQRYLSSRRSNASARAEQILKLSEEFYSLTKF